jgi:hypothetical protein
MFKSKTGGGMRGLQASGWTAALGSPPGNRARRRSEVQLTSLGADGRFEGHRHPTRQAHMHGDRSSKHGLNVWADIMEFVKGNENSAWDQQRIARGQTM